ncbi:hypothetical protein [Halosegnis marinus]|uniref:Roadblock/LC7 domain-containing protein n=1 Tax=Halosegnis marinus TaxID=3034023 RepID=A0ABD5ZLB1_9EURY|nr:hypothetical protein [Halosegnis sp. DT85]
MVRSAVREDARRVAAFVNHRAPGGFLGAAAYDADGYEVFGVRDEVRPVVEADSFDALIENARGVQRNVFSADDAGEILGTPEATTLSFADLLVVQLPVSRTEAVLIALDPSVGSKFTEFVDSCREQLESGE